jgi:hypothetical protein
MQLTFLSEEPHVKRSRLPVSGQDWLIRVASCRSSMLQLLNDIAPDGWSGKTSPVSFRTMEEEALQAFWGSSPGEALKSLRMDGNQQESSRVSKAHMASHGECLTLNMSEWTALEGLSLNDAGVCSLSDILEIGDVPPQYYLSPKACAGILRRADKRRKTLPAQLRQALAAVAALAKESEAP